MNFSVYIGSAITITKVPTEEVKKSKNVCSSKEKHKLANGDFCPICGSAIITKKYSVEEPIDIWDLWEDFSENYGHDFDFDDNTFMARYCGMYIDEDENLNEDLDLTKFDLVKFKVLAKDLLKYFDEKNIEYKVSSIVKTIRR